MGEFSNIVSQPESYSDYHMKSHDLIYAATDLTARMMDICALMLTHMQQDDWFTMFGEEITPEYSFNADQLSDWFGIDKKNLYVSLQAPSKKLASKTIGIVGNGSFEYFPILSKITYKKGILTIKPNGDLRNKYITNISQNGHAKIDNHTFKALSNPNHKKIFEFLCRFREEYEMYPISLKKVQTMFGVFDGDGKVLKSSYSNPTEFIRFVVEPSLLAISKNEVALSKLEILSSTNQHGKQCVGYELYNSGDELKIRFLVKWKTKLTQDKASQLAKRAADLSQKYKLAKEAGEVELDVMTELEKTFRQIGYDSQADSLAKLIEAEIKNQEEKRRFEEEQKAKKEFLNLDLVLKGIEFE
ncbi:hypothetical protein KKIDH5335_48690 (plasmid) [Vibrio fluvialis]|nr:hypothetical protein KKIDH5335_48690 [Vibrio fluvialis]